jgi:vacuolar-type H+-ATPase subunit E/Vma4
MDARSSLTVAALSVALREHRVCAMADAEARVRSAEQRAERIRELVQNVVQETLECIEWLEGEGRVSPLMIEPVLLWVQQELRRIDEFFPSVEVSNGQARP